MSAAGGDESVEEYEEVDALDDSDDDFAYEEVDIEDIEDDDLLAGDDEDLETAMRSLQGLGVLKEALRLLERHYPETMHRVFFYRPNTTFRMFFAVVRQPFWHHASSVGDAPALLRARTGCVTDPPLGSGLRSARAVPPVGATLDARALRADPRGRGAQVLCTALRWRLRA